MKITEIFYSLQGEGILAGRPSVFIRIAGCPLRCRWCDTQYAWSDRNAHEFTIEQIVQATQKYNCSSVVVTGGEPMVNQQLPELLNKLKETACHITVETAGIKFIPDLPCDLMSISPKLSNSSPKEAVVAKVHNSNCLDIDAVKNLIRDYNYQLKFVVEAIEDLKDIWQLLDQLPAVDKERVMLMPQASTRQQYIEKSQMVADLCKNTGFSFCQRLHILLYDDQKGV